MKKIILLFVLVLPMVLSAQYDSHISADEATVSPSSPEASNPSINYEDNSFYESGFGAEMTGEMLLTSSLKYIALPIRFKLPQLKQFTFSVNIPVIISKKVDYFDYTAQASGISDITVGTSYWKDNVFKNFRGTVSSKITLPTGDDEKTVEHDGFDYKVPLGTGCWGLMTTGGLKGDLASGFFTATLGYKINITKTITTENETVITDVESRPGNMFLFNSSLSQAVNVFKLTGSVMFAMAGDGESKTIFTDKNTSEKTSYTAELDNNYTLVDLGLLVEYPIKNRFINKCYVKVRIPVITTTGKDIDKMDRSLVFNFGIKKGF